jgi:hypothetical protein
METTRMAVEVNAGVVPGVPMPEYRRVFTISDSTWQSAGEDASGLARAQVLADANGKAQAWAIYLMMQPDRVNWVHTNWVWF